MKSVTGSVPTHSVVGAAGVRVSVQLNGQTESVMATWLTGSADVATTSGLPSASIVSALAGSAAAASDWPSMVMLQSPAAVARNGLASDSATSPKSIHGSTRPTDQRSRPSAKPRPVIAR